jgi:sulfite reductase (NADPH) flavoprotein alpha-component
MTNPERFASSVHIIFGTTTGNSEILVEETAKKLEKVGLPVTICDMEDFKSNRLDEIKTLLIIVSTDVGGEPPASAYDLFEYLHGKSNIDLGHLAYSVLALGDYYYASTFCKTGKDFDIYLKDWGPRE